MAIVVVRHGRTAVNAGGRLLGRADPELDDEGRRQAQALADAIERRGAQPGGSPRPAESVATGASPRSTVRRLVSSPLGRCRATAEAVGSRLNLPVEVDERWIELDYGELDGAALASIPAETWAAWRADTSWAPPGGESMAQLGVRVRAACDDLAPEAVDDDVVVVTHVSPIKAAVAWALDVDDEVAWRLFVAPASITRIAIQGHRRSLHSFNETSHLRS